MLASFHMTTSSPGRPPLSIVILAAGQGKRMNSDLPKVLQPLACKPLLAHVLDTAKQLSAAGIHVVYGHGGDRVREALAHEPVQWALQAEQLGTGHAVAQALPAIPDDHLVLILFGDVPLIKSETLEKLLASVDDQSISMLSVILRDPTGYGRVIRDHAGHVVRIVEHKDANTKERTVPEGNTGVMAVRAESLRKWLGALKNENTQREYYLTDIVSMAVREGLRVKAVSAPTEIEVLGANDHTQLAQLETALRSERATQLLVAGAILADPLRVDVRGDVTLGRDVFIDVNVVLVGNVRLGDRTHIGPNCYLEDCEIGPDTRLFPNCVVTQTTIGAACSIGPFARFRPGARLEEGVHIGNFVEVKNSHVGKGSKANHLSYLGDATIGEKVNVGAGTITCNYDGANKYRTEIGDGSFIGSGTMLVAPITVGANATIGAGSTLTKNAPEGKLTLERAKQMTIEGWKRPEKKV
jgi:bifunctional UDP-N-acetylglucosamine pyrophosphorylase/glucosamine-1-phosphate N-acetyltransferase